MKIRINPVYEKEIKLRVRSYKFAAIVLVYNILLVGLSLVGFEVAFNIHWNSRIDYAGASMVYMLLVSLEVAMVVFMVPSFTAGSIAGEREKQTLDILLTTTLKPSQIIYGKLMSSISMILLLVISSLPAISLVFTIGGVGFWDLMQFVLVVFVTAVFIGSIGILGSTLFRKTVQATVFTFGMVVLLFGVTVAIAVAAYVLQEMYYANFMNYQGQMPQVGWATLPMLFNPAMTVVSMMGKQYGNATLVSRFISHLGGVPSFMADHWIGISLLLQGAGSILCLIWSSYLLNPLRKRHYKKHKSVD